MYTLGSITLPRPHSFNREQIEYSTTHNSLSGRTTKDLRSRKEAYRLSFRYLTQSEVSDILSEYDKETTVNFLVSDGSLTITATPVHIEITNRGYNTPGSDYREDFELLLIEET